MKAAEQDACIEGLDGRLAVSEARNRQILNEIGERLEKSDGTYYEVLGSLTTVDENSKETLELASRIDGVEERNQQFDESLAQFNAHISDSATKQKEELDKISAQFTDQVSNSDARHQEQLQDLKQHVNASENATKGQIDNIREGVATSKKWAENTSIGIINRLLSLEHTKENQSESTNDVESQLQIHADDCSDSERARKHFAGAFSPMSSRQPSACRI